MMGFLFKNPNLGYGTAFFYIGCAALVAALVIGATKFAKVPESVDKPLVVKGLETV
jgi:hypothetical protein